MDEEPISLKKKRKGDITTIAERLGAPRGGKPLTKEEQQKIVQAKAYADYLATERRIAGQK